LLIPRKYTFLTNILSTEGPKGNCYIYTHTHILYILYMSIYIVHIDIYRYMYV
jgi:hypothetical protein